MKKPVTEASKDFFNKHSLNEWQLSELQQMMQRKAQPQRHTKLWFSVAASVAMFFVVSLMLGRGAVSIQDVSNEVVYNHIKNMPLEVQAPNFKTVQAYFSKLDFSLLESELMSRNKVAMLGGRYCSIGGVAAAQLRYKKHSQEMTLYQVPYDEKLYGDVPDYHQYQKPLVTYVKGYRVEIWRENGLLMACVFREASRQSA